MKKDPQFSWDNDLGIATCAITDPETSKSFVGYARVHPEDKEFQSEKIGCEIAEIKANIMLLESKLKRLKGEYNTLEDLCKTFKQRPNFDKNDPTTRIVLRKKYAVAEDINTYMRMIKNLRENLTKYVEAKDRLHDTIKKLHA